MSQKITATEKVTLEAGHSPWAHAKILAEQNKDKVGPDKQFKTEKELYNFSLRFLMDHNEYIDRSGRVYNCDEVTGKFKNIPLKYKGEVLNIPKGFNFEDAQNCREIDIFTPPVAAIVAAPPPPAPAMPTADLRPLAQFDPAIDGAVRNASGLQTFMAFYGKDPVDAAADRSMENSRIKGGALNPNNSEGRKFRGTSADVADGAISPAGKGIAFMARAGRASRGDHGELNMKPSALVHLDRATGEERDTNHRFPFKPEENTRFVYANGQLGVAVDGAMTISDPRKNDPFHAGFITDHTTATNLVNQWNNTGKGQEVITQWMGLTDAFKTVGTRFLSGTEPATAEDAEKLLQYNVKLALHPISWSVDSRGVPAADVSVIRDSMEQVLNSDRFKTLAVADQDRLRSTYQPLEATLDNPIALRATVKGQIGQWARPLDEKIAERLVTKDTNIPSNYYDIFGKEKGRDYTREDKVALAEEGLRVMSRKADEASIQGPTEQELRLGTGLALNSERQNQPALATARIGLMDKIGTDAAFREDVAAHVVNNPEALQKWSDMLFHSTRATGANSKILGFKSDSQADKFANEVSGLLGGEKYKGKLDYYNSLLGQALNPVVQMATVGMVSLGKGANQRRGLEGFPEEVQRRYNDPATHDDVVKGLAMIADRARIAQENGVDIASTSLAISLSPRLAEEVNGGVKSDLFRNIEAKAGSVLEDQWAFNGRLVGNAGAQVEQGTERKASTSNVTKVDDITLQAGIADALKGGAGIKVAGLESAPGFMTGFNVEHVRAAGATLLGATATANTPGKVSQAETDRETVQKVAASSPQLFSLLAVDMLAGNAPLDAVSQKNLRSYIATVDAGGEGRAGFSGYADMLKKHAKAFVAAGNDAGARNAAELAAMTDISGYFAQAGKAAPGSKAAALPGLAVGRLAGLMAGDDGVSAAFDTLVGGPAHAVLAADATKLGGLPARAGDVIPGATFSGTLSDADLAGLTTALSGDKLKSRTAGLKAWLAAHTSDAPNADGSFSVQGKVSASEFESLTAGANHAFPSERLAGVSAVLNSFVAGDANAAIAAKAGAELAGKTAGAVNATLAGGAAAVAGDLAGQSLGDRLAGLVSSGAITADDRTKLLAYTAAPTEEARLAGLDAWMAGYKATESGKTAHTGVSLVEIGKLLLIPLIPNKTSHDKPVIGGEVPECTNPLTCVPDPTFPGPGIPGGPKPSVPGVGGN